jgi:hypothetical protein
VVVAANAWHDFGSLKWIARVLDPLLKKILGKEKKEDDRHVRKRKY